MGAVSAVSSQADPVACARELRSAMGALQPTFVVFFATPQLNPKALGDALANEFGAVPSLGCTTAGEIGGGKMLEGSVALLALDAESVRSAKVSLVGDAKDAAAVDTAVQALGASVGQPLASLSPERYVGLVVHDGLSGSEGRVMAALCGLTNVPFVGGSAGDDLRFEATHTFVDFAPTRGGSAIALLEPVRPFRVLKTQSFSVLDKILEATDVDEATRTVKAFNGRPAAQEYADQLGIDLASLPEHFRQHPLGLLLANGEPFVRSPQRVANGHEMRFYCQIKQGMRLSVLDSGNIVEQTRSDLDDALQKMDSCSAILNFHCIQRTLLLKKDGLLDEYGALFTKVPSVGFSTYGESYIGHINQTSTMVLFG